MLSLLLAIHWACETGESTEYQGACICGCQDAAAPTVRSPFFRNADAWSGVGGRCRRSTCRRTPVETTTAPASLLDVCQRINGENGTTRHAAAPHSFYETSTSNARFFDRHRSKLADDPASPPQVNTLGDRRIRTALCVNFRQGLTALHARHGTTVRTHPNSDTPPPIASTETTGHP